MRACESTITAGATTAPEKRKKSMNMKTIAKIYLENIRSDDGSERGWTASVTDDDGGAAGNIVRDDIADISVTIFHGGRAVSWEKCQPYEDDGNTRMTARRSRAINGHHTAIGAWQVDAEKIKRKMKMDFESIKIVK